MADKIYMDTELMKQLSNQITQLQRSLSGIGERISRSVSEVRQAVSEETGIISKLTKTRKDAQTLSGRVEQLARAVSQSATRWEEVESKIARRQLSAGEEGISGTGASAAGTAAGIGAAAGNETALIGTALAQWMKYPSDPDSWSQTMTDKFNQNLADASSYRFPDGSTAVIVGSDILLIGADGALTVLSPSSSFTTVGMTTTHYGTDGSWSKSESKAGIGGGWSGNLLYQNDKGEWKSVKKDAEDLGKPIDKLIGGKTKADRIGEIATIGAETKVENALQHAEVRGESGIFSGEASESVCHGEAEASFKAGLYATKVDADGKVHYSLEPGIDAKAGASFSLFDAEASGKIGNDYLNVHGDAGVAVGKVDAEVEVQLGIVDGKPSAHVGGSAEAIAAEAHASAGVDILGLDTKVKGSVNVGIGAHADLGYHDGTLHVDIGASLGVGASVKVDVDVGGFVDNVAEKAGDVVDAVSGFGKSIWNSIFG